VSRCFCLNNQIMDVYNRTNILNQIPIQKILLSKNFVERALGFHFRGETRISRHCVRRPHLPLVETKGEWRKLTNGRAPFYNHVAIEKGSRQLRREGKLECLDKAWKCVYVCVRERECSWLARGEFLQTRGKYVCVCERESVDLEQEASKWGELQFLHSFSYFRSTSSKWRKTKRGSWCRCMAGWFLSQKTLKEVHIAKCWIKPEYRIWVVFFMLTFKCVY